MKPITNGIALALLAYATFSWGDACIKAIGGRLSVFEVGFFATAVASVCLYFTKGEGERWRYFWQMKRKWLVQARALSGTLAGVLGVYAFTTIPLAEAYSLIFLAPLFATLLSVVILKEQVGPWRWGAVLAGLFGVLLVVRPGFRELALGHLAAAGIALLAACTVILLRTLSSSEKRTSMFGTLMLYALAVNGVGMLLWGFTLPNSREVVLMLVAGVCIACGHVLMIQAAQAAPASHVAPTHYSQIVWAVLIGALLFGEFPDGLALIGLAIVSGAGLLTLLRERIRLGNVRWNPFRNRL